MIIYYNKDTFGYPINIVKNAMYDPDQYGLFNLDTGLSHNSRSHCVLFGSDIYTLKYYSSVGLKVEKRNQDKTSTLMRDFGDSYNWNSAFLFSHDGNLFVFMCDGNNFHYYRYDGSSWQDEFVLQHGGSVKICDVVWYQNKIQVVLDNCIIEIQIGLSPVVKMAGISFAGAKFCEYNTKLYLLLPTTSRLCEYIPQAETITTIRQYTGVSPSTNQSAMTVYDNKIYFIMSHLRGNIFEVYDGISTISWNYFIPITLISNSSDFELHLLLSPIISASNNNIDGVLWKFLDGEYRSYSVINDTKLSWSYI